MLISYAQNLEDVILHRALQDVKRGFYIDVGANDPEHDSVTRLFYERGWRGINIEPVDYFYNRLRERRMWEDNLQCAASNAEGELTLYEVEGTGLSTSDPLAAAQYAAQDRRVVERLVPMKTLTAICSEYAPDTIHFLKIDVEGAETLVLEGLDLHRFRPWIILVEAVDAITREPNHSGWEPMVLAGGYRFVYFDGLNRFYLAEEEMHRERFFAAPPNVFDDYIRYDEWLRRRHVPELKTHIAGQETRIKKIEHDLHRARHDLLSAQQAYHNLNAQYHLVLNSLSWRMTRWLRVASKIRRRITDLPWIIRKLKPLLMKFPWLYDRLYVIYSRRKSSPVQDAGSAEIDSYIRRDLQSLPAASPSEKPLLVFISPLPPARSGIADYSMALLKRLQKHYTIIAVCENTVSLDPLPEGISVVSGEEYLSSGSVLNRHLYHFGNSAHHIWMLPLLERFPGSVMLHDLFLSGLYHSLARKLSVPIQTYLFADHGYDALQCVEEHGVHEALVRYPLNRSVISRADAILVHSHYSYSRLDTPNRYKIPFPKALPVPTLSPLEAKERLGFAPSDFLVCTFGFIGPSKCARELIEAWGHSSLSADSAAHLVFVGELPNNGYADELVALANELPNPAQIRFTGYCDAQRYAEYLAASDLVVQLRRDSRGETSAAAFDALSHAKVLLVNANGAMGEFPSDVVVSIPDRFTPADLSVALDELHGRESLRARIASAAFEYVKTAHDPERSALAYRDAIESAYARGAYAPYREALAASADIKTLVNLRTPKTSPTLFIDVSDVAHHDLRTGIQRVVRSILHYISLFPQGYRIAPVRLEGGRYLHAHRFMARFLGFSSSALEDTPASIREGDVFLGLDLYVGHIAQNAPLFHAMRDRGVKIHFVVYDILPLRFPHFFPPETYPQFVNWFGIVCEVSTSLCCISRAVADDVADWLDHHPRACDRPLRIESFPLGADIENSAPTTGITPDQRSQFDAIRSEKTVLMVGTIEPRKGHEQALAAFELLWAQGSDAALIIVGKAGWMVDDLIHRLRSHPEKNRRLFWFEGASDELLNLVYGRSDLLLAASYGEGFGLPLIEASRHGIALLVRDIPVFREVAGEYARYFRADSPSELAAAIAEWFDTPSHPSGSLPYATWRESSDVLMDRVLRNPYP